MVAILTNDLKQEFIKLLINDVADSNSNFYVGIGRSEEWNDSDIAPTPLNTLREIRDARLTLQAIKSASDVSFVVPRNNWSSGRTYSGWRDDQSSYPTNPFYVITEDNSVYLCLQQGRNSAGTAVASTVQPTGTATTPFKTADGYVWKFLYSISASTALKFLSANFMPVRFVDSAGTGDPATDIEQYAIQNAAIDGQIGGIIVTAGGSGYSAAPTVTITGDGTNAQAIATVSGGVVTKIEIKDSSGTFFYGSNYNAANVTITGTGSGAAARAIIAPPGGFGADPRVDLRSTSVMFHSKPSGTETGKFITDNDFRQVVLIKNVTQYDSDALYSTSVGNALNYLKFRVDTVTAFTPDNTIQGATSLAKAIVDTFDSDKLYYHQNTSTGFLSFQEGETVSEIGGGIGTGILDSAGFDADSNAFVPADIDKFSGKILYIENRAPIQRSTEQSEDIKIIIQL